jgi:hypothetical protein
VNGGRAGGAPSPRTRVRRIPHNARYDRGTIDAILDEAVVGRAGAEAVASGRVTRRESCSMPP